MLKNFDVFSFKKRKKIEAVTDDLYILSVSFTKNRMDEDFNEVVTKPSTANLKDD